MDSVQAERGHSEIACIRVKIDPFKEKPTKCMKARKGRQGGRGVSFVSNKVRPKNKKKQHNQKLPSIFAPDPAYSQNLPVFARYSTYLVSSQCSPLFRILNQ